MGGGSWLRRGVDAAVARCRGASPLILASGVIMALSLVWFAVNLDHLAGPPILLWLPMPASAAVLTAVYLRTSRVPTMAPPLRRFWRHMTLTAVLVGIACVGQAVDVLTHPGGSGPRTGPVMLAFDGAAVLVIVYALYRLPLARGRAGEVLRVGLDAGTVMLATAVFTWHFLVRKALTTYDHGQVVAAMIVTVLALAAVVAVAKVVLSSYALIDRRALRLFAMAMLVGSIGPMFQELVADRPHLLATQISLPVLFFVAALAGERQRQAALRGHVDEVRHRRPFSMLPYAAVAAADLLLIGVLWDGQDARAVGAGVVLITGLVVLRQMTAFRDNGRLFARLNHGATHDALTGLPNRALFGERLNQALTGAGEQPVSVALIDLDGFKSVNDTYGHEAGDQLLIGVAERLRASVRSGDTVARLGGDEFVAVLTGADAGEARLTAERMIAALREPVDAAGRTLTARASIGLATGRAGDEPGGLLRQADTAMYAAKDLPGSVCVAYDTALPDTDARRHAPADELRAALDDGQFFLLYQPIVDMRDGRVLAAEALVRWNHPQRGLLAPDTFIPVAERSGAITDMTRWIVREGCAQLARWIAAHDAAAPRRLHVNVSVWDLRRSDFSADVAAALRAYGVPAQCLVLEVTESAALEPGAAVENLERLRALGVGVSLDDFGTGHSTLTLLHHCPVDEIKLDRSFVTLDVGGRPPIAAVVIHLAQALGVHVVAEGVETQEQADHLRALGYTAAQGYLYARPLPPDDFAALLTAGAPTGSRAVQNAGW